MGSCEVLLAPAEVVSGLFPRSLIIVAGNSNTYNKGVVPGIVHPIQRCITVNSKYYNLSPPDPAQFRISRQIFLKGDGARSSPNSGRESINSHGKQEHTSCVHPPVLETPSLKIFSRLWRTAWASNRSLALSCQHFLAIFQTSGVIPGASKLLGFGGRFPLEIMMVTLWSVYSGNGIFPVAS